MFFITGMMGPYMAPMALNVPISMLMSMVVAFTITPWLSYHAAQTAGHTHGPAAESAAAHGRPTIPKTITANSLLYRLFRRSWRRC